ncbi:hypothetical protein OAI24_01255 [Alphaproteobacteria bacterium]|nr:hypothetical protein [Alphaproteobacteria bacterium]
MAFLEKNIKMSENSLFLLLFAVTVMADTITLGSPGSAVAFVKDK